THRNTKAVTSHLFLPYAYTEARVDELAALQGVLKDSKGCIDFGHTDTTTRVLIGGSQSERSLQMAPPGLATQNLPTVAGANKKAFGLILNSHWINGTDETQHASVKIKIMPAKPHTVKRYLTPI